MPSVVIIDAARRTPGQRGTVTTYVACPLTQCDITVKVCLRNNAGEKVPLQNVEAEMTNVPHRATTDAEGIAKFIGFPPANGRQAVTITVRLQGNDRNRYAWYNWYTSSLKTPYSPDDTLSKTVSADHQELFYFEAAERQSRLVIEVFRADGKRLPNRVGLTVTPDPRPLPALPLVTVSKETLYRGIRVSEVEAQRKWWGLREGTKYRVDRVVLNAAPGVYNVRVRNLLQLLREQDPNNVLPWSIHPPGAQNVTVTVPAAGEARIIYTLNNYTDVQFVSLLVKVGAVGVANLAEDLKVRCDLLKRAIETVRPLTNANPNVLKVFMAPEFYFQGPEGNYPLDLVDGVQNDNARPGIMKMFRPFFADAQYKDWLFVLGTAIGGLKHDTAQPPYRLQITHAGGTRITVGRDPAHRGSDAAICGHILIIPGWPWRVEQNGVSHNVTAVTPQTNGTYFLDFAAVPGFVAGTCNLYPPRTAAVHKLRITNAAATRMTVDRVTTVPASTTAVCANINHVVGWEWRLEQNGVKRNITAATAIAMNQYNLDFAAAPGFVVGPCDLHEPGSGALHILRIVAAIQPTILTVGAGRDRVSACQDVTPLWRVMTAAANAIIQRAVRSAAVPGAYDLHVANTAGFQNGDAVYLLEPAQRTEVFNIALIAKGGPDPQNPGNIDMPPVNRAGILRELTVYKEHVSSIDYTAPVAARDWWDPTGGGRRVMFGTESGTVLPTQGSRDTLGGIDSIPRSTGSSEVQANSLGGGAIFTVDGVTFGMDVCLDHAYGRLDEFYRPNAGAKQGNPYPQIHLIPSCGMNIGGGPIRVVDDGPVFNVDGGCFEYVVLRRNNGHFSCDKHIDEDHTNPRECPGTAAEHNLHFYCKQPHNQTLWHDPFNCWCHHKHTIAAPRACPCGQNLVPEGGGAWFRCPTFHWNSTHRSGLCWCTQTHTTVLPLACQCGTTLIPGEYHHCAKPHNLIGLHTAAGCWCGGNHTTVARGNCLCGQGLVAVTPTTFACPRQHTNPGFHDSGACWCTQNHTTVAPLACRCGTTLKAGNYLSCTRPHNQTVVHGAGTCTGPCTHTHTNMAHGTCTVCTRPLLAGQVHACPGYWEQVERHASGNGCFQCTGNHTVMAPGNCATCGLEFVQAQYFHCERQHNLRVVHQAVACPCTVVHTVHVPGACPVCAETLRPVTFYNCVTHGIQYTANCATCLTLLVAQQYFYCPGLHNLLTVLDAAANCLTCNNPLRAAPFFSCPGLHNQVNPGVTNANCPRCNTAPRPTPYYHCGSYHNQTAVVAAGPNCGTCNQGLTQVDYFYCEHPHALTFQYDARFAANNCVGVGCGVPFVRVDYFLCSAKHAHNSNAQVAGNCAVCFNNNLPLSWAYATALKRIGSRIPPQHNGNVAVAGLTDSQGAVRWDRYFRLNWGRYQVFPIFPIPPGETVR